MTPIFETLEKARLRFGALGEYDLARDMASLQCTAHRFIETVSNLSACRDGEVRDGDGITPGFQHDTGDSLDCLDSIIHAARKLCGKPHDAEQADALLYNAG